MRVCTLSRLVSLGLVISALSAGQIGNAVADQFGEFDTSGGTAYGVRADLTLRRPGLGSADLYDNKVRGQGTFGDTDVYAGYRAYASGALGYITQIRGVGSGTTTVDRGKTTQDSNTTARVSFRASQPSYVVFTFPIGVFGDYADSDYQHLWARSYMTSDSAYLSPTFTSNLGYYATREGAIASWGEPSGTYQTPYACARESTQTSYYSAHRSDC